MGKLLMDSLLGFVRPRKSSATATDAPTASTPTAKDRIGVLTFEVSSLMSKLVRLWHSLSDEKIARLRDDTLHLHGILRLVSRDDSFLLGLALSEMLDAFAFLVRATARLGKRCFDPVLRGFDLALSDLLCTGVDVHGLRYPGKKIDEKVRKMERFAETSVSLYQEMEVLVELEQALRRMQPAAATSNYSVGLMELRQKVAWQRQELRSLREASLWNRTYDYVVLLLARSLFTIIFRIESAFGVRFMTPSAGIWEDPYGLSSLPLPPCRSSAAGEILSTAEQQHGSDDRGSLSARMVHSGPLAGNSGLLEISKSGPLSYTCRPVSSRQCLPQRWKKMMLHSPRISYSKAQRKNPGGPFGGWAASQDESPALPRCIPSEIGSRRSNADLGVLNGVGSSKQRIQFSGIHKELCKSLSNPRHKMLTAPPWTLGATGLALHYANVIILIEKLAACPHLIGPDARDDLYSMLPKSIRSALRAKLKTYSKNITASIYDPVLASEWNSAITRILVWLAPLAHNMVRWQSERSYEHQRMVSGTNILLLQTLYFANQEKTEAAMTELLVGLNYLCRFGRELGLQTSCDDQIKCISGEA